MKHVAWEMERNPYYFTLEESFFKFAEYRSNVHFVRI